MILIKYKKKTSARHLWAEMCAPSLCVLSVLIKGSAKHSLLSYNTTQCMCRFAYIVRLIDELRITVC